MDLKLNKNDGENGSNSFIKNDDSEGGLKLFQNKKANKALIIAAIVIALIFLLCVVFVNIQLPWK